MSTNLILYWAAFCTYFLSALTLVLDATFAPNLLSCVLSGVSGLGMCVVGFACVPRFARIQMLLEFNGPGIVPWWATKICSTVGPLLNLILLVFVFLRGPSEYNMIYWFFLIAPLCSLCLTMLFRPVATDFGGFFPLCGISAGFSLKYYAFGPWSRVTFVCMALLIIMRGVFESITVWRNADLAARTEALNNKDVHRVYRVVAYLIDFLSQWLSNDGLPTANNTNEQGLLTSTGLPTENDTPPLANEHEQVISYTPPPGPSEGPSEQLISSDGLGTENTTLLPPRPNEEQG